VQVIEISMAVTTKNAVFWDVTSHSLQKFTGHMGKIYFLNLQGSICTEDTGSKLVWNAHKFLPDYVVSQPRR
jgi:hypothetical protein